MRGLALDRTKNLRDSKHGEILNSGLVNVDSGVPAPPLAGPLLPDKE